MRTRLALTVDDGVNSDVVRLYTQFAKDTGVRMTYFVNGTYRSWTDNADLLRPLVESGQIQLGNHTWSHPDLTTVSQSRMADEINRNSTFLKTNYGVDARPYLRPPYGRYNASVAALAANLGYTVTTLWSGSLSDSTVVTEDYIVKMADQYFKPRNIVIGHLNHPPVTHVYDRLVEIIRNRNLRTVTLNDVFAKVSRHLGKLKLAGLVHAQRLEGAGFTCCPTPMPPRWCGWPSLCGSSQCSPLLHRTNVSRPPSMRDSERTATERRPALSSHQTPPLESG